MYKYLQQFSALDIFFIVIHSSFVMLGLMHW